MNDLDERCDVVEGGERSQAVHHLVAAQFRARSADLRAALDKLARRVGAELAQTLFVPVRARPHLKPGRPRGLGLQRRTVEGRGDERVELLDGSCEPPEALLERGNLIVARRRTSIRTRGG